MIKEIYVLLMKFYLSPLLRISIRNYDIISILYKIFINHFHYHHRHLDLEISIYQSFVGVFLVFFFLELEWGSTLPIHFIILLHLQVGIDHRFHHHDNSLASWHGFLDHIILFFMRLSAKYNIQYSLDKPSRNLILGH